MYIIIEYVAYNKSDYDEWLNCVSFINKAKCGKQIHRRPVHLDYLFTE